MKKYTLFLIGLISMFLVSCSTNMMGEYSKMYDNAWELEYITGPRIAFQGLYPNEKPVIMLNKGLGTVTGTSSCNVYNTRYKTNGKMISFAVPEVSTLAFCGDGETVFLETMKQVDNYRMTTDGKLELLMNNVVMMRFKKSMK